MFIANGVSRNILQGEVDEADHKAATLKRVGKGAVVFRKEFLIVSPAACVGSIRWKSQRCFSGAPGRGSAWWLCLKRTGIALSGVTCLQVSANREPLKINIELAQSKRATGVLVGMRVRAKVHGRSLCSLVQSE
jgi:hypothetical protein